MIPPRDYSSEVHMRATYDMSKVMAIKLCKYSLFLDI